MKVQRWVLGLTLAAMGSLTVQAQGVAQVSCCAQEACCDSVSCDCAEPDCGCETTGCDGGCCEMDSCDAGCCETDCCDSGCCDSGCGLSGCGLCDCDLGEAWTLKGAIAPCCGIDFGGWTQIGYHNNVTPLSVNPGDVFSFNDRPDRLNLHQQWFYAEKTADGSCGLDWGFRADVMYGIDAAKTQSFGNNAGRFDYQNGWDFGGGYGWAMPQLYGELASGDWSVIVGHFYTLVGYEVVTAPDNFFYSHALTMFNSEPFTHTGALATYSGLDDIELYGGWTAGWDTGFDQNFSGSNFLGGFSATLTESATLTYITTAGNFGARSQGEDGYSHSVVLDYNLSDEMNYVFQTDYVDYDDPTNTGNNNQVGINQYLFYTLSDCVQLGSRVEWWKTDSDDYYATTLGTNIRTHANVIFRPEIRFDWNDAGVAFANGDDEQTTFGMDAIFTF